MVQESGMLVLKPEFHQRNMLNTSDTVSCCFSKGLGAPVGSAIAGSKEFIQRSLSC